MSQARVEESDNVGLAHRSYGQYVRAMHGKGPLAAIDAEILRQEVVLHRARIGNVALIDHGPVEDRIDGAVEHDAASVEKALENRGLRSSGIFNKMMSVMMVRVVVVGMIAMGIGIGGCKPGLARKDCIGVPGNADAQGVEQGGDVRG